MAHHSVDIQYLTAHLMSYFWLDAHVEDVHWAGAHSFEVLLGDEEGDIQVDIAVPSCLGAMTGPSWQHIPSLHTHLQGLGDTAGDIQLHAGEDMIPADVGMPIGLHALASVQPTAADSLGVGWWASQEVRQLNMVPER